MLHAPVAQLDRASASKQSIALLHPSFFFAKRGFLRVVGLGFTLVLPVTRYWANSRIFGGSGAPAETRTRNQQLRRLLLYPFELRALACFSRQFSTQLIGQVWLAAKML